jgi:HD-like signal output (HDOD) protein
MNSADVFEQIEKMGGLPSLPQTLLNIQKVASDNRSSADDLAECILKDQALTMRVLKVVNSVMYQRRNREQVRTVRRAVIVMGFNTVRQLALGLSVFDMMSKLSRSPMLADISRHSLVAAGFAQVLAEASGRVSPEEAFVTALVHDIGKVVLIECSPVVMDKVQEDLQDGAHPLEAERRRFGITHDRAGRRLAAHWGLPYELQNVIGEHHDIDPDSPPRNLDPLLGTIVYANAMAHFSCTSEQHAEEHRVLLKAGRALGIAARRLDDIYVRVGKEIEELSSCMGFDVGNLADYGSIVNVEGSRNVAPKRMSSQEIARRTADQLCLYQKVGMGVAEGKNPDELLDLIIQGAVDVLGFERVIYFQADRDTKLLRPVRWAGMEAAELARKLNLPLTREAGAVAICLLEHRPIHVPMAGSEAYGGLAGEQLLAVARCTGFAVAPVVTPDGVTGVIYGDCGPEGADVVAEQAQELQGLAMQMGLVLSTRAVKS